MKSKHLIWRFLGCLAMLPVVVVLFLWDSRYTLDQRIENPDSTQTLEIYKSATFLRYILMKMPGDGGSWPVIVRFLDAEDNSIAEHKILFFSSDSIEWKGNKASIKGAVKWPKGVIKFPWTPDDNENKIAPRARIFWRTKNAIYAF